MKLKRGIKHVIGLGGALCLSFSVLACPMASMHVYADSENAMIQPYKDDIQWRWKVENNKLYKRLFNYSTISWVGDWIYVRDLP